MAIKCSERNCTRTYTYMYINKIILKRNAHCLTRTKHTDRVNPINLARSLVSGFAKCKRVTETLMYNQWDDLDSRSPAGTILRSSPVRKRNEKCPGNGIFLRHPLKLSKRHHSSRNFHRRYRSVRIAHIIDELTFRRVSSNVKSGKNTEEKRNKMRLSFRYCNFFVRRPMQSSFIIQERNKAAMISSNAYR